MSDIAIQNSRVAIAQLSEQPHQAPVLWLRARALNSAKGWIRAARRVLWKENDPSPPPARRRFPKREARERGRWCLAWVVMQLKVFRSPV